MDKEKKVVRISWLRLILDLLKASFLLSLIIRTRMVFSMINTVFEKQPFVQKLEELKILWLNKGPVSWVLFQNLSINMIFFIVITLGLSITYYTRSGIQLYKWARAKTK